MGLDYGTGISRSLQPENRSFDTVVMIEGAPLLDSEQNLMTDIVSERIQRYINSQTQSGFSSIPSFIFNSTWSNKFQLPTSTVFINGKQLTITANGDNYIYLSPATAGLGNHRYDFVFIEMWRTIVKGTDVAAVPPIVNTAHKPTSTTIYKDGNVQNTTSTISDDLIDTIVAEETTRRSQLQFRIRIQENATAPNQQNSSIFDGSTYGQGAAAVATAYTFTNMGATTGDYGLWRAGNGDAASISQLESIDGYTYAIPIAFIFRRSNAAYSDVGVNGQNASAYNIASLSSDRLDGLFYDSVVDSDVIDLRHKVIFGEPNYDQILKEAIQDLLTGNNKVRRPITIQYDALSDSAISDYTINSICDKTRSTWSDLQTTVVSNTIKINIGDTNTSQDFYTSKAAGLWAIGDTITVKVPNGAPTGTIILGTDDSNPATKPYVYANDTGLNNIAGSWSGTGTATAVFTINVNLSNQEIWIVYDIQYPANQGLSYTQDQLLFLTYVNAVLYPTLQSSYVPHAGVVRTGTDLKSTSLFISRNTKQLNFTHSSLNNTSATNYAVCSRNKAIDITPLVSSTSAIDGSSRSMHTRNYVAATKRLYLPFTTTKTWFVRGVYSTQSGGAEYATTLYTLENPSVISGNVFQHPSLLSSFAKITSIIYDPSSTHVELLAASGGAYYPVFRQNSIGDINQFVLIDGTGNIYHPPTTNPVQFQITHNSLLTANVSAYTSTSLDPATNFIQLTPSAVFPNGQQLWIDIDYIGEPHDGAQIKIGYKYLPYQGLIESSGMQLSAQLKTISTFVHSDGTGNITSNIDTTKYPRPLITNLPTPRDTEHLVKGDSIAGTGSVGLYDAASLCYANSTVLDYSTSSPVECPISLNDIVTAMYNVGLNPIERGGNDATSFKSVMMLPLSVANYKQAIVFGLAISSTNIALKNELVLYVWTYTNNDAANLLTSADGVHIGVDFFFINGRYLIRV